MSLTPIEWATHVLNAFTGCDRVSAGCASCYAIPTAAANQRKELGRERKALEQGRPAPRRRYYTDGDPRTSGPGFGFRVHWDKLRRPPRFPAGARVFVNSMSDVFHDDAPTEAIVALWSLFASRPDVTWIVLTKRDKRMHEVLCGWRDAADRRDVDGVPSALEVAESKAAYWRWWTHGLPNVCVGVSIENRSFVHRADVLRATPAAVRLVSAEPLLGPLVRGDNDSFPPRPEHTGWTWKHELDLTGIDWLIVGGESGAKHRRFDPAWARDLRDACLATSLPCNCCAIGAPLDHHAPECDAHRCATAFFFKQHGGRVAKAGGRVLDGRTWDELPPAFTRELAR